ncbi:hypothetical protein ACQR1I_36635 [Bradyrhizobium sp. HKCCYLS2038]|uniref:hypothetical protein n=1 Tax=Bradyrhizobium sp. HKCCYLS2038 TaxID=3420764 RepID=UPI003EB82F87
MNAHEANSKVVEIAKALGMEANYRSGMYTLRLNGQYVGQMSAEAWLDHLRHCLIAVKRS